jgi:hypothetical protein
MKLLSPPPAAKFINPLKDVDISTVPVLSEVMSQMCNPAVEGPVKVPLPEGPMNTWILEIPPMILVAVPAVIFTETGVV